MLASVGAFLKLVLSSAYAYVGLVSGGYSFVQKLFPKLPQISRRVLYGASLIALFLACFNAWKSERQLRQEEADKYSKGLKEASAKYSKGLQDFIKGYLRNPDVPFLTMKFGECVSGNRSDGSKTWTEFLFRVSLRNSGGPSALEDFRLEIRDGALTKTGKSEPIPERFVVKLSGREVVLNPSDGLEQMTKSPVPNGAIIPGYLLFRVDGEQIAGLIKRKDVAFVISYVNVVGSTSHEVHCGSESERYWPGTQTDFNPVPE